MYREEWVLLGSGPGAKETWDAMPQELHEYANIACVNGSYALLNGVDPDAYGVFELGAMRKFRKEYSEFASRGTYCMTRPSCVQVFGLFGKESQKPISFMALYNQAKDANKGHGFIGSGTVMLLGVGACLRACRIHVVGMPGYSPDAMYDDSVPGYEGTRDQEWCDKTNRSMGWHIGRVTQRLRHCEIYWWGGKPQHATREWRVNYVD